ncbi:MAG TPA: hypothetical protein VGN08_12835 [Solirubrobacteraceae bacterium]
MTSSLSSKPARSRRATRARHGASRDRRASRAPRRAARKGRLLGRYDDRLGRPREVIARPGAAGSVLVIDRDELTRDDRRLVAHLAADEPAENGTLICAAYIEDVRRSGIRCRPLTPQDRRTIPFEEAEREQLAAAGLLTDSELRDRCGNRYRIERVQAAMSIPELRWRRHPADPAEPAVVVSVRDVVAAVESYEPACGLSLRAVTRDHGPLQLSSSALRTELTRVRNSPIVLNRGLREAAVERLAQQQLSMSEIAIRCGRVKRDRKGNESGETSWLARRLGVLPEAGQELPTPWVHTDVLALIARRGLGLSPRDVEVT